MNCLALMSICKDENGLTVDAVLNDLCEIKRGIEFIL